MITYLIIFLFAIIRAEDYLVLRIVSENREFKENLEGSSAVKLIPGGHHKIYTIFENHDVNDINSFCIEYLKNPEYFIFVSPKTREKVDTPKNICKKEIKSEEKNETKSKKSELYNATFSFEKSSILKNIDISDVHKFGFLALYISHGIGSTDILLFNDIPQVFKFDMLTSGTSFYLKYFDMPNLYSVRNIKMGKITIPDMLLIIFRFKLVRV